MKRIVVVTLGGAEKAPVRLIGDLKIVKRIILTGALPAGLRGC